VKNWLAGVGHDIAPDHDFALSHRAHPARPAVVGDHTPHNNSAIRNLAYVDENIHKKTNSKRKVQSTLPKKDEQEKPSAPQP
jgi:hypothetical protein